MKIGKNSFIMKSNYFLSPWLITIGNGSHINRGGTLDGRGIIKSVPLGLEYMKIAGDNEFAPALFIMGIFYEKGNFVEKNVEKAKQLYRKCPLPEAKRRLEALEKN